ncbi:MULTISPECIES: TauD/TfdA family dioxygenase [unclassified Caballeronia]|uniref:TauD/TfdA dioxygenase family protein n=1 Tax=unclassified Caballeronia TaxID=2646786 RepID=UPI002857FD51|nr:MULTISPECIES: TauD/TfdA family dioxygenase [unclassified Caballeronia]MDR5777157.1 TauD/TfdA family dioxygenase [Caballeronia sp. LZ002]MDR5852618.1 TauD/TfdA family dioxygenase [Caballeronia sp. LZ003]
MPNDIGFTIRPLNVGAEIVGLNVKAPIASGSRDALYQAWLKYGVLLFRETGATNAEHLALSRCFGELELHPVPEIRLKEEPLLIEIGGSRRGQAFVFDGTELRAGRLPWHRDTAYTPECCKGAILHMVEAAAEDGETMVADTALAYDALSDEMKRRIAHLEYKATLRLGPIDQTRPGAFWRTVRPATPEEDPAAKPANVSKDAIARYPSVVLPAVITHPESGRKCVFLSPTYVDEFLDMSAEESDALLAELTEHITRPEFCYVHRWKAGDMLLWDNRRFMHAARGFPLNCTRRGLRTTLAGSLKVGRYFDPEPDLSKAAPIAD